LQPHPHAIEPLDERTRIGKLRTFGKHGLLEDHRRQFGEVRRVLAMLEVLDQVVFDVELVEIQ
jgi:hypothetical protein